MLRPLMWLLALTLLTVAPRGRAAPDDAAGAQALDREVETLSQASRFDEALAKARQALALRQKALPAGHWRIGSSKSDVGALYLVLDDHVRATPLLEEAVRLLESKNPQSEEHAAALANLAALHRGRGEIAKAIELNERSLALTEKVHGPEHSRAGVQKRVLALLVGGRDHDRAEQLLKSALAIHDKNKDDRGAIAAMLALANLRRLNAKIGAEEMYQQAIERARTSLPADDPMQARLRIALASQNRRVASSMGSPEGTAKARKLADEQFADAERTLIRIYGAHHTELADLYSEWAFNAEAAQDLERAAQLRTKASDIEERHLAAVLASGSEYVKQQYLRRLQQHTEDTLGLHKVWQPRAFPDSVAELAATTILRRKGRVLDVVSGDLATLRKHAGPEEKRLLEELLSVRAEIAAATIRGPQGSGYKEKLQALEARAAALENQVSTRSVAFRAASAPITLEAVRAAIPQDAALVEIVRYAPRDPRAYSAVGERWFPRYVAYVLRKSGKIRATYLGEAHTIDSVVQQFRKRLSDPADRKVGDPAWRLYTLTFARIRGLLGDAKRVLIAPDGALNIVPFGALMDDKGFLAEQYTISYLSSGRDLLRFRHASSAASAPVIVANPAYDALGSSGPGGGTRAGDLSRARFPQLPGTAQEAQALAKLLPRAAVLSEARATEAALKDVRAPEILHVATHGFFLSAEPATKEGSRGLELDTAPRPRQIHQIKEPLLRSGLALAGANVRRGGARDDGILTALEATGLDLHGTKLVALSACETALGDVEVGEGVFGLRRALVVAGAESQLLSLWKVDDEATRDLMTAYYARVLKGEPRAEALRAVQLEMMRNDDRHHPYYWASFILSGNPAPLGVAPGETTARPDQPAPMPPPQRGCACTTPASAPREPVIGLLMWICIMALRRPRTARRLVQLTGHDDETGLAQEESSVFRPQSPGPRAKRAS